MGDSGVREGGLKEFGFTIERDTLPKTALKHSWPVHAQPAAAHKVISPCASRPLHGDPALLAGRRRPRTPQAPGPRALADLLHGSPPVLPTHGSAQRSGRRLESSSSSHAAAQRRKRRSPAAAMVFYFYPRGHVDGKDDYIIYMGRDKYENEVRRGAARGAARAAAAGSARAAAVCILQLLLALGTVCCISKSKLQGAAWQR